MRRPLRLLAGGALALLLVVVLGSLMVVLLFPPTRIRSMVLAEATRVSGYALELGDARLGWSAGGVVLHLKQLAARSPDGAQEIRAPVVDMRVDLWPLLRRVVAVRRLAVEGLEIRLSPPPAGAPGASPAGPPVAASPAGLLSIPQLSITGGRIVQESPDGTIQLEAVALEGRFESRGAARLLQGEGRAGELRLLPARGGGRTRLTGVRFSGRYEGERTRGSFKGNAGSDSLEWLLPAAGEKPPGRLLWPGPAAAVEMLLEWGVSPSIQTDVRGRLGPVPFTGRIDSRPRASGASWGNSGSLTLSAVGLDSLRVLFPPEAVAATRAYALGGRLDGGQFTFAPGSASDSLDFTFKARIVEMTAALPEKGRVVDAGTLDLEADPSGVTFQGHFVSGTSRLSLVGSAGMGERSPWQAQLSVKGPAAEALRFLPTEGAPRVTAGRIDLDLRLSGRLGDTTPPGAEGQLQLSGIAATHPALAVPITGLDLKASFAGDHATLESGRVVAGRSSARFRGTVRDLRRPVGRIDIDADEVQMDELFPEPGGEGAAPAALSGAPAKRSSAASLPISGRIRIARFVRQKVTLTDLVADYDLGATGMRMKNLEAAAWGGRITGDMTLTPTGPEALDYSGQFQVEDARLADLLGSVSSIRGIDGRVETQMTLSGRNGPTVNSLMALTLEAQALVIEGAILNLPAVRKVAEALSLHDAAAASLPFRTLKSRFQVTNGFVRFDSCAVSQAGADWTLKGRVGLDGTLDLPITARIASTLFEPGSDLRKVADLLAGPEGRIPIGLTLTGTVTSPTISVDIDPLLRQARDKARGAAGDELRRRIGGLFRKP